MVRRHFAAAAACALLAVPVSAQSPAPPDFQIRGSLDVLIDSATNSTEVFSTGSPIWFAGWAFECRSGLQPQTQRTGEFSVRYWRVGGQEGTIYQGPIAWLFTVARPDVVQVHQFDCPAVGPNVGYVVLADPPKDPGLWHAELTVTTTDGAGRKVSWTETKTILVQPAS